MSVSVNPNRATPVSAGGPILFDAKILFYWAILDARSGAGLGRKVILYALLSIASPYPIWGSTEPSPVAANAITSAGDRPM